MQSFAPCGFLQRWVRVRGSVNKYIFPCVANAFWKSGHSTNSMPPFFSLLLFVLCAGIATAIPAANPVAVPAASATRPPTGAATISKVAVDTEGSGCRSGTVAVAFAPDNSALTLILDGFHAGIGPGYEDFGTRAFCRVNVTMSSPGWAFDVQSVDFRSYVNIQKGVEVSLVSRWKWIDTKGVDMKGKVGLWFFVIRCQEAVLTIHRVM